MKRINKISICIALCILFCFVNYKEVYANIPKNMNLYENINSIKFNESAEQKQQDIHNYNKILISKSGLINLDKPILVDIKRNNKSVYISWKRVKNASGYYICIKGTDNKWYKLSELTGDKTTCYIDKYHYNGIRKDKIYTVVAYKKNLSKVIKSSNFDRKGITYIDIPIIKSITKNKLKWTKVNNIDGYEIIYKDIKSKKWLKAYNVDKNTKEYDIEKIYKKNRYYSVRAYRKSDNSIIYSNFEKKVTLNDKKYSNKSILFEGDGIIDETLCSTYSEIIYPKRVEELLGAKVTINTGKNDKARDVEKRTSYRKKYFKKYDLICIAIGTNDYEKDTPLNEFKKSIESLAIRIKQQNNKAKVILITPVYRGRYKGNKDINCNFKKNNKGHTLRDYCDIIEDMAKGYRYNLYDLNRLNTISTNNVNYATVDYIYPTSEYHAKIGCNLVDFILEEKLLKIGKKKL